MGWRPFTLFYQEIPSSKLLEESGFKILKVSGSGLFAKSRNCWPSLLTGDLIIKAQKF